MSRECGHYEELLGRLVDDGLTAREEAELRAHLRTCPRCAALGQAMFDLSDVLREDTAAPPAALAEGVMVRVRAEAPSAPARRAAHAQRAKSAARTGSHAAGPRKPVRLWTRLAAAACLALILGGVAFASLRGRLGRAYGGDSLMMEAAMEPEALDAGPVPEPEAMPEPEEAPAAAEPAAGKALPEEPAAMAPEEPMEAEGESAAMQAARSEVTESAADLDGVLSPVQVPEGREADFEAIIRDARHPVGDYGETRVILTVEYRGALLEFLTDAEERELFWRDAAEGVPVLSPEPVSALWDIFG